jgi:hypothetical protein
VTDHQMRLFMKHRTSDPIPVAAARAGFSAATGYRIAQDPRLPSAGGLHCECHLHPPCSGSQSISTAAQRRRLQQGHPGRLSPHRI